MARAPVRWGSLAMGLGATLCFFGGLTAGQALCASVWPGSAETLVVYDLTLDEIAAGLTALAFAVGWIVGFGAVLPRLRGA